MLGECCINSSPFITINVDVCNSKSTKLSTIYSNVKDVGIDMLFELMRSHKDEKLQVASSKISLQGLSKIFHSINSVY